MSSQPDSSDSNPRSRPWIISLVYWNDVAKDTVKALTIALVVYIGGVIGGVFKLHHQVLSIAAIVGGAILAFALLGYLANRILSRWSRLLGSAIGAATGAGSSYAIFGGRKVNGLLVLSMSFALVFAVGLVGRRLGSWVHKAVADSPPDNR
jgi:hypothetical protein